MPYFDQAFQQTDTDALWEPLKVYREEISALPKDLFFNNFFGPADVAFYYSLVRWAKPRNILEVGSGYSTRVVSLAVKRNGVGAITCIDPEPRVDLRGLSSVQRVPTRVEDVGREPFEILQAGDVLFLDSSHTAEEARYHVGFLAKLPAGVHVHYHDIDYPWPRPTPDWNEDDVIHDFIRERRWQVRVFGSALTRDHLSTMRAVVPHYGKTPYRRYNALWLIST